MPKKDHLEALIGPFSAESFSHAEKQPLECTADTDETTGSATGSAETVGNPTPANDGRRGSGTAVTYIFTTRDWLRKAGSQVTSALTSNPTCAASWWGEAAHSRNACHA